MPPAVKMSPTDKYAMNAAAMDLGTEDSANPTASIGYEAGCHDDSDNEHATSTVVYDQESYRIY
jgi:hypothetical protein